jgi:holo-[acyl-carrier protein] synthase
MKVLGIGVDIIHNKRFKLLSKKKIFIKRIYGKNEIKFSKNIKNKLNYFAKRFAAKESLSKALGTGFRKNLNYKDIEILNNKLGKPYYYVSPKIQKMINNRFKVKRFNLFLSISDEKDYSVAFTILQV